MFVMKKNQAVQGQSQISSKTSDPDTAFMRVFVGNLNTLHVTKKDLRTQFAKYGFITAISIHRGFAFVQYNNPTSARNAVHGENGTFISGQQIDINIAAEPKPNQKPQGLNPGVSQSFGFGIENQSVCNGRFNPQTPSSMAGKIGMNIRGRGTRGGRGRGSAFGREALTGLAKKVQTGRVEKHISKKTPLARKTQQVPISNENKSSNPENVPIELIRTELLSIRQKIDNLLTLLPQS